MTVSAALLAANERLMQKRQELGVKVTLRPAVAPPVRFDALVYANEQLKEKRVKPERGYGSGSAGWLDPIRGLLEQAPQVPTECEYVPESCPEQIEANPVRVYVSLSNTWLKRKTTTQARFWLLMRHIDRDGRGWLWVDDIRERLTDEGSIFHVCGQRQFENILNVGNGVYWHIDNNGRLRITGAAALCRALGIERLSGHNVTLSIDDLTNGIARFNAALYGAFHAARGEDANPISRAVIRDLTGVSERRQREYDRLIGVSKKRNFAIEDKQTLDNKAERVWTNGRAYFAFTDHQGKQGKAGVTYNARRLPNSYQSPYQIGTNGRKKKINANLSKTLVKNGTQEKDRDVVQRLFFSNGRDAARAMKRGQRGQMKERSQDAIWTLTRRSDYALWQEWNSCH